MMFPDWMIERNSNARARKNGFRAGEGGGREREFRDPRALTGWTGIAKDVGKAVVPL